MLFGHEDKIKLFKRLVEEDNLSHAYLFYGPSGIGKFGLAHALAFFLESGEFETSGAPLIDSKICFPDEKGKIGVEVARKIKTFLSEKPFKSPRRLVIVRDAETLTTEAESALLKVVEEPPLSSLIIFVTTERLALFAPLSSRLSPVYFRSFSKTEVADFLKERHKISRAQSEEIAAKSFGRIDRAMEFIEGGKEKTEDKIVSLYFKGVLKNSAILSELLSREAALRRYNLNQNLQQKAIEYLIG